MSGTIWIELVLYCLLIVPGVVYTVWRHSTRRLACPHCGGEDLVPASSPRARQMMREMEREQAAAKAA